jgi:eukaryotic-like serine/threonine-protein kinase
MDISGDLKLTEVSPPDLLPVIQRSGILSDRQFEEISGKVRGGEYPAETLALAERLLAEGTLTLFQTKRLLLNKSHGLVVGPYVILDRLGVGGRGRVFKAQHRLMGRLAALKVIAPQIAKRASSIARFHREMRLIGRLDHPNVVRAFDADQAGDLLYIVMEYVVGKSLDNVIGYRGQLPAAEVAEYMAQAALGLAHAHERGIVHRDVKPANLLLSEEGQIKVLDLGLSALLEADSEASFATADGRIVGTVNYMSPEQATALGLDGRSDLFSLGCTMYELLCGRSPFPGETIAECLALRITGRPVPIAEFRPDLSPRLVEVLLKLLARRPEDRFQTAAEAAQALRALADQEVGSLVNLRPELPPAPAASVPEPVALPDFLLPAAPSARLPSDPPSQASSFWFDFVRLVATHRPVIALLILLVALALFGLGFALGLASARPAG